MSDSPLVITFYTENTPYQLEVAGLINSCRELGIELEVEAVPCLGSWQRNCAMKPQFIRGKLIEKKRPVFWVDADAVFRKVPDFSLMMHSDFSAWENSSLPQDKRFRYRAGSLFINYTPGGIRFAEVWAGYCQKKIDAGVDLSYLDQIAIFDLIEQGLEANFFPLPLSHCKVFDLDADEIDSSDVVIEHFQASRRYKPRVGYL
jgi:hypothetical protein